MYEARQNKEKVSRQIQVKGKQTTQFGYRKVANETLQLYQLLQINYRPIAFQDRGNNACLMQNGRASSTNFIGNGAQHSEEKMIDYIYSNALLSNSKIAGNNSFQNKQYIANQYVISEGRKTQDMYTYYIPCNGNYGVNFNCDQLLSTVLTDNSIIYYQKNNRN